MALTVKIASSTQHFWETVASLARRRHSLSEGHGLVWRCRLLCSHAARCRPPTPAPTPPHTLSLVTWRNETNRTWNTTTMIQTVSRLEYTENRSQPVSGAFSGRSARSKVALNHPSGNVRFIKTRQGRSWKMPSHLQSLAEDVLIWGNQAHGWQGDRKRHEVSFADDVEMFCFPVIASLRFGGWFSPFKVSCDASRHPRGRGAYPFNVAAAASHQESASVLYWNCRITCH